MKKPNSDNSNGNCDSDNKQRTPNDIKYNRKEEKNIPHLLHRATAHTLITQKRDSVPTQYTLSLTAALSLTLCATRCFPFIAVNQSHVPICAHNPCKRIARAHTHGVSVSKNTHNTRTRRWQRVETKSREKKQHITYAFAKHSTHSIRFDSLSISYRHKHTVYMYALRTSHTRLCKKYIK